MSSSPPRCCSHHQVRIALYSVALPHSHSPYNATLSYTVLYTPFCAEMSSVTPDASMLQLMVLRYGADPLGCLQLLTVDPCGTNPSEAFTPRIWMSLWACLTHDHHTNRPTVVHNSCTCSRACHLPSHNRHNAMADTSCLHAPHGDATLHCQLLGHTVEATILQFVRDSPQFPSGFA